LIGDGVEEAGNGSEAPLAAGAAPSGELARVTVWPWQWPERVKVVFMSFLSFIICNMDRINVSVAIIPMAQYYGWSQSTVGIVQSSFFWGYVLTQIPGGYMAHKFGGKQVLGWGVVAWSLMTFVTPAAASTSFYVLLAARVLLGVGEGVAMPAMNNMISSWVPAVERSRSLSLIYSGMYMGSVVGLLACPKLISEFGWQSVFYSFGALGLFWWILWQFGIGSTPENCPGISEEEKQYIFKGRGPSQEETYAEIPWKRLLSHPAAWAINVSHFCCTWGYFVLLIWLPTYFNSALGFDLKSSAFLAVLPWLAMFTFANVGGLIADKLIESGMSTTRVRKIMQTIGFLGPSSMLTGLCFTQSPQLAVGFMTAALGLGSFSQSGVYSNHQVRGGGCAGGGAFADRAAPSHICP